MDYFTKLAKKAKYFIYRNIHKGKGSDNHNYSLRNKSTGRVERRGRNFYIKNGKFKVSEKGRKRVLKEGRKNVHAGVVGLVTRKPRNIKEWQRVSYNPRKDDFFRDSFQKKVEEASVIKLTPEGVFMPK